jgi:hypothetical protein
MDAIMKARDGDVQMMDVSIVRTHQRGATAKMGTRSMSGSLAKPSIRLIDSDKCKGRNP